MSDASMETYELVAFTVLLVAVFGIPFYYRRWEKKFLRKKTKDAISKSLREEIEKESAENKRKKNLFDETLRKLQG